MCLYFLITKQKFPSKIIYFKGNKLYIHLTFINTSTLHIFHYACRKTFKVGNKKEIFTFKQQYLYINIRREWIKVRQTYKNHHRQPLTVFILLENNDKTPFLGILSQSSFLRANFPDLFISATLPLYVEIASGIFSPISFVYASYWNHRFFQFELGLNSFCFFSNIHFNWSLRKIITEFILKILDSTFFRLVKANQTTKRLL